MEANFDGLVGPTHHYAGLSFGNVASTAHAATVSSPRQAARQGLAKMRKLMELGIPQGVLPPHPRPRIDLLKRAGFTGTDAEILKAAERQEARLLSAVSSASAMWVANAATVSPSSDSADGKVHFTPANLVSKFHRSIEPEFTARALRLIFSGNRFVHHPALPAHDDFGDEGAANHTRLGGVESPGVQVFVFGKDARDPHAPTPQSFPARQTRLASESVARAHRLDPARTVFVQQNPRAIDAGVFHNDVIAVGHREVYFTHEQAYLHLADTEVRMREAAKGLFDLKFIVVPKRLVSLEAAIRSYLFNSQLLTKPDGTMFLLCPEECRAEASVWAYLQELIQDDGQPIREVITMDLRQSMQNGGGPACLRLRVELTAEERAQTAPGVWLTPVLASQLEAWVDRHYRDRLNSKDLADPELGEESRRACAELEQVLGLTGLYT